MSSENLSPEDIEKAFKSLLKITKKSVEVVRRLDGKTDYIKIGKDLGLHKTIVSAVQKESHKSKLTKKVGKFYKKKSGIMRYAPKIKIDTIDNKSSNEKKLKKLKKKIPIKISPSKKITSISFRTAEAQNMAIAYQWLYVTENALRDLIRKVLGDPKIWWTKKCPNDFKQEISEKKNNLKYNDSKRRDELECSEIDHLKKIISRNWNEFKNFFEIKDKQKFIHQFESALPTRNSIGHCVPLEGMDMKEVSVRFNDILKTLK